MMFGRLEKTKSFPRDRVIIIPTSCEKAISTCDLDESPMVELRRLESSEKIGPEKTRNVLLASKLTVDKRNATFYSGESFRTKRSKFYEKLNEVVSSPKKPYSTMQSVFGKESGKGNLLESKNIIKTDSVLEEKNKLSGRFEVSQLENPEKRQKSYKREENIIDLGYKPVGNMDKLDLTMTTRFELPGLKDGVLGVKKNESSEKVEGFAASAVFKPELEGNKTPLFGAGLPKDNEPSKTNSLFSAGGFGQTASAFIADSKPQSEVSKPTTSLFSSSTQPTGLFGNASQLGNSDASSIKSSIFPSANTSSTPSSLFTNPSGSLFGGETQKPSLNNETVQESKKLFEANTNPESNKGLAGNSSSANLSSTPSFGSSVFTNFGSAASSTTAAIGTGGSLFSSNTLTNTSNPTTSNTEKPTGLFTINEPAKPSLFSSTEASKPLSFGQTDTTKSSFGISFGNPSSSLLASGDNKTSLFGQAGDLKLASGNLSAPGTSVTSADNPKTGSLFGNSGDLGTGILNSSVPKAGLFGAKPDSQASGTSLFSANTNQGGLFSGFKTNTSTEGSASKSIIPGGFSSSTATTGSLFGASSLASNENKGSLFGSLNPASGSQSLGLFGNSNTSLNTSQGSGNAAGLFGSKSEQGLFGSSTNAGSDKTLTTGDNKSGTEADKSTPFGVGFLATSFQSNGTQSLFSAK